MGSTCTNRKLSAKVSSLALGAATAIFANVAAASLATAQDAAAGETVFKKCRACHQVGVGAKAGVGPVQNNLIGRTAGTFEGFNYSPLNKAAGEAGLVWTEAYVIEYLADPNAFLKKFLTEKGKADLAASSGSTKMMFKLADETDRKDVVAYLKTQDGK